MSSNFRQIRLLTTELAALERLKHQCLHFFSVGIDPILYKVHGYIDMHNILMGKCCLHASSFIFYRIIIRVAGNQDRHKSSDKFYFGLDQTTHFGVTCPRMTKILHFRTWISLGQMANLDQILCGASLGVGKGCIMFWGRLAQNSGVHGNRKPPLTYNGENGVSTFSRLLLIRSFLYLQVTRTCIKSRRVRISPRLDHWLRS